MRKTIEKELVQTGERLAGITNDAMVLVQLLLFGGRVQ
jgi:hypothetical protein